MLKKLTNHANYLVSYVEGLATTASFKLHSWLLYTDLRQNIDIFNILVFDVGQG